MGKTVFKTCGGFCIYGFIDCYILVEMVAFIELSEVRNPLLKGLFV